MLVVDVRQRVSTREGGGRGRQEGEADGVWVVTSVDTWDPFDWDHLRNQVGCTSELCPREGEGAAFIPQLTLVGGGWLLVALNFHHFRGGVSTS